MALFRRRRPRIAHPYFGALTFMPGDYWEGELVAAGVPETIGITVQAPETGPTQPQVDFCRALLDDLDALFERCRPVFEGRFEEWTSKPFPVAWREEFSLVGLDVPPDGNPSQPWSVTYFVDAANHYFTAFLEDGRPSYMTVDG
jgi:hypothetical protein